MQYPIKLDADIFIKCIVIDIFLFTYLKIQDCGGRHLGFSGYANLVKSGVLILLYLCSAANLVQIYVIVTEIDALMLLAFIL